jgi:hypothetical protein
MGWPERFCYLLNSNMVFGTRRLLSEKVCTTSRPCGRDGRGRNSDVRKQRVDFVKLPSKY